VRKSKRDRGIEKRKEEENASERMIEGGTKTG